GRVGLDDHPPRTLAAPRPPRYLREQLEHALAGAEVGQVQSHVRADHADDGDRRQVEPLREHLRADQYVRLVRQERREDALVRVTFARDVAVPAQQPRLREGPLGLHLDLLDAEPQQAQARASARAAGDGQARLPVALMADEPVVLAMVCQRYLTARADGDVAAVPALHV